MNRRARSEVISFHCSLSPNNVEMPCIHKYPFATGFMTSIAVAFNKTFQLRNLDIELEGSAVAVS